MREGVTRLRLELSGLVEFITREYWDLYIQKDQQSAESFMADVELDLSLLLGAVRRRKEEERKHYTKGDITTEAKPPM